MGSWKEIMFTKLEEKKPMIEGYKIKAGSTFDMGELYESMHRWFIHKGYDWKELRYKHVDNPNGSVTTEIFWECSKALDDYVTFVVEMGAQIVLSEAEVTLPNNAKKKMHKGSIEMKFSAYLKKNVKVWEGKSLGQWTGLVYEKILIRKRLEEYEKAMLGEINTFFDEIRLYLQIR
ncbi:MAG: hypothetical protein PHO02_02250 [Candidatus Nanoarchaeia archaeon]|nr:hypothetical protein [Candidatus Nanoarchaeia archaeon]